MPYSPTDWVDGVTPVDASRLDKMEAGLVAAEEKSWKGVANGYASLDATGKVPLAQLPPSGGVPAPVVNGQWIKGVGGVPVWAAITAADVSGFGVHTSTTLAAANADLAWPGGGSPLVWDNVNPSAGGYSIRSYGAPSAGVGTRLVLRPPGGTPFTIKHNLAGGSGVVFWINRSVDAIVIPGDTVEFHYTGSAWMEVVRGLSTPKITYGTTLPTSPADGDIHILTDSITTPNYTLSLRYNNSSTVGYKWEYIGGTGIQVNVDGTFSSSSFADVGSGVVVPYNGNYYFEIQGTVDDNYTQAGSWSGMRGIFWDRSANTQIGSRDFQSYANQSSAFNRRGGVSSKQYVSNLSIAGHLVGVKCQNSNNTTQMELFGARLTITPRMIG